MFFPIGAILFFIKKDPETYRIIGLVGSFGFTTAGALAGGYFLGTYVDKRYGTAPWFLMIFLFWGAIGSFINFFQVIKKISDENENKSAGREN
ncbi:MAG: hypothetical protein CV080_00030 [Candidatus Kuenenia stuttgartiensis]|nr:AtpZ/AtpI family protein [Candidatus Kuenenia stuttgartiensis]TVM02619.1 MAG: hypothetical protein CV080_00030 [Candidatus Kuenenia stuttgartiensis]